MNSGDEPRYESFTVYLGRGEAQDRYEKLLRIAVASTLAIIQVQSLKV
jgi:hypothetical protein